MFFIRVPSADEAMLISGGKSADTPFRVVVGRRAFVLPILNRVAFLTLEQLQTRIEEECLSIEKIPLYVKATCAFRVPNDQKAIIDAAQRFLSNQQKMPDLVGQITSGHLRGIVGEMRVEEIISKRAELQGRVLEHSKTELGEQGLQIDSFTITSVKSITMEEVQGRTDFVATMAQPHFAIVRREAAVAQAKADQEAAQAQQEAVRKQAEAARETAVAKAKFAAEQATAEAAARQQAEVAETLAAQAIAVAQAEATQQTQVAQQHAQAEIGQAQAEADRKSRLATAKAQEEVSAAQARAEQAGPLAGAQAAQAVTEAQTTLAEQAVSLKEQELERDVIKPAEADKKRRIAQAEADSQATRLAAEAAAAEGRISLDQLLIEQMPALVGGLAEGLKGSHLTILNGPDGISEVVTGLVSQVGSLFGVAQQAARAAGNGNGNGHVSTQPMVGTEVSR